MPGVKLVNVNKVYDNDVQAVFDFNLDIKEKEFVVFVGPSGCGKSTTLRMIAGLEEITDGELYIDDVFSNNILAKNRNIAMVFQNYALYPHMSVYENMAFGLKNRKVPKAEINQRVLEAAKILDIEKYLNRKPKALSGGQCQRVALGRAIVRNAKVFLMDEPLSNLDAKLRVQMRSEIIKLHNRIGATTIYVTHDQTEAMTMADRIVVMNKGYIQQIGTPREIYNHPTNMFVASFIGSPSMNFIECTYDNGDIVFNSEKRLSLDKSMVEKHDEFYKKQLEYYNNQLKEYFEKIDETNKLNSTKNNFVPFDADCHPKVIECKKIIKHLETCINDSHIIVFGVRPENISVSKNLDTNGTKLKVEMIELLGKNQIIHCKINETPIQIDASAKHQINIGEDIFVRFDYDSFHLFDKETQLSLL